MIFFAFLATLYLLGSSMVLDRLDVGPSERFFFFFISSSCLVSVFNHFVFYLSYFKCYLFFAYHLSLFFLFLCVCQNWFFCFFVPYIT